MNQPARRLTARSAVATADLELLRVARTELDDPGTPAGLTFGSRLRGLARFRVGRPATEGPGPHIRF
jgi:hypothetical protein